MPFSIKRVKKLKLNTVQGGENYLGCALVVNKS